MSYEKDCKPPPYKPTAHDRTEAHIAWWLIGTAVLFIGLMAAALVYLP
jgi:hypothetical protein